eukprot:PLAT577.1.p1 GENE.PLAT577.1~~PLAT577.1.p1  ORF type:complete len:527 (-),score=187.45 PLAT577.1:649-2202(-)
MAARVRSRPTASTHGRPGKLLTRLRKAGGPAGERPAAAAAPAASPAPAPATVDHMAFLSAHFDALYGKAGGAPPAAAAGAGRPPAGTPIQPGWGSPAPSVHAMGASPGVDASMMRQYARLDAAFDARTPMAAGGVRGHPASVAASPAAPAAAARSGADEMLARMAASRRAIEQRRAAAAAAAAPATPVTPASRRSAAPAAPSSASSSRRSRSPRRAVSPRRGRRATEDSLLPAGRAMPPAALYGRVAKPPPLAPYMRSPDAAAPVATAVGGDSGGSGGEGSGAATGGGTSPADGPPPSASKSHEFRSLTDKLVTAEEEKSELMVQLSASQQRVAELESAARKAADGSAAAVTAERERELLLLVKELRREKDAALEECAVMRDEKRAWLEQLSVENEQLERLFREARRAKQELVAEMNDMKPSVSDEALERELLAVRDERDQLRTELTDLRASIGGDVSKLSRERERLTREFSQYRASTEKELAALRSKWKCVAKSGATRAQLYNQVLLRPSMIAWIV